MKEKMVCRCQLEITAVRLVGKDTGKPFWERRKREKWMKGKVSLAPLTPTTNWGISSIPSRSRGRYFKERPVSGSLRKIDASEPLIYISRGGC